MYARMQASKALVTRFLNRRQKLVWDRIPADIQKRIIHLALDDAAMMDIFNKSRYVLNRRRRQSVAEQSVAMTSQRNFSQQKPPVINSSPKEGPSDGAGAVEQSGRLDPPNAANDQIRHLLLRKRKSFS